VSEGENTVIETTHRSLKWF